MNSFEITTKLTYSELNGYFLNIDKEFVPPISSQVDLSTYISKLYDKASFIAAKIDAEIVGLCAYYKDYSTNSIFITSIGVMQIYTSNGIASILMRKLVNIATESGFNSINLEVADKNEKAKSFYVKFGFKEVDRLEKIDLNEESITIVKYARILNERQQN